MAHKENVELFNSRCNECGCADLLKTDGLNIFVHPEIPDKVITQVINTFNLSVDECILVVFDIFRENRFDKSIVVTDWGISFVLDEDEVANWLFWSDIKHVEFTNNILFFYDYNELDVLSVDFSLFVKDRSNLQIIGIVFSQIFDEIAKRSMSKVPVVENNEKVSASQSVLEQYVSSNKNDSKVRKYSKYEIEMFKENSISKVRDLLILWSVIAFICLLIGGFMVVISMILAIPIIILFLSYLSLKNKADDYWQKEYSKQWKNLSDYDKLKTVGRVAGVIFKIFG